MTGSDRGQAHTLESFTAALLIVAGLIFALQATAVTPLSASTSNQHIENQERAMAGDLLAVADRSGALEAALLDWNASAGLAEQRWAGAPGGTDVFANPGTVSAANRFGAMLNRTFLSEGIAVNVYVTYRTGSGIGGAGTEQMVYMGSPSDNAVVATRTVVMRDDQRLSVTGETVATAAGDGRYFAPDAVSGPLFNVMEVRIVVWQM